MTAGEVADWLNSMDGRLLDIFGLWVQGQRDNRWVAERLIDEGHLARLAALPAPADEEERGMVRLESPAGPLDMPEDRWREMLGKSEKGRAALRRFDAAASAPPASPDEITDDFAMAVAIRPDHLVALHYDRASGTCVHVGEGVCDLCRRAVAINDRLKAIRARLSAPPVSPDPGLLREVLDKAANQLHDTAISIREEGYDTLHAESFEACPHPFCGEMRAALAAAPSEVDTDD